MRITKITINNFNSIGSTKNTLVLERDVTALIGKNESGKSSILDAINSIRFTSKLPHLSANINRQEKGKGVAISFLVELYFSEDESEKYGLDVGNKTVVNITNNSVTYEGELSKLFTEGTEINMLSSSFCSKIEDYKSFSSTGILINMLKGLDTNIITDISAVFNNCTNEIATRCKDSVLRKEIEEMADELSNEIESIYSIFPLMYKYTENNLKDTYSHKDIIDHLNRKRIDQVLGGLLYVAGISRDLMLEAITERHAGTKDAAQDDIKRLVEENINVKFNEFYNQNNVKLKIMFEGNEVKLNVESGLRMNLSEQSDGLKWYLSFFIDICYRGYSNRPILFLIDEPGVYLHVDAQAELLNMFYHLTSGKDSLIYATHSPFMLNSNYPTSVRIIQKPKGYTEIINKYYSYEVDGNSKEETLSPLLKGIGASLSNTIFPLFDKPCLITEGITDKLYIEAMLKVLYPEDKQKFYVVPSVGVSNIDRLVSIFIGWGIEYSVLLDFDKAGFAEYKELTINLNLDLSKITFINLEEYRENVKKCDYKEIESLISESDLGKLETYVMWENDEKISKTIIANEFFIKVVNSELLPDETTQNNFKKLIEVLSASMGNL